MWKVVIGLIALTGGFLTYERLTFERDAWLADYDELRSHVSSNYANLLWVVKYRDLDPVALHESTLRALNDARSDRAARKAIRSFVAAFQDGHFRFSRMPLSRRMEDLFRSQEKSLPAGTTPEKACAALGFRDDTDGLTFESDELQILNTPDNSFRAGMYRQGDQYAGIVRISSFDAKRYLGACRRAWRTNVDQGPCDTACVENFTNAAVPNQLLAEFSAQVRELERVGAKLMAVDITGNGGGTNWVEPAARIVTKTLLNCASVAFIKGPHWTKTFSDMAKRIEKDMGAADVPTDITVLKEAHRRALDFGTRANRVCELDGLWTKGEIPECSNLVDNTSYSACGLMGPLPHGSLVRATARDALFHGLGYTYEEGVFSGRVAVLVDGGTASAAEYFAAILADNDSASILGQRTLGVGCGYTNGNEGVTLTNSGLHILLPDCQRRRRDGTNEMAGIVPDATAEWTDSDSAAERWAKLMNVLAPLLAE